MRLCRLCGAPPESPRAYYCDRCRPLALLRRRREGSARLLAWRKANPAAVAASDARAAERRKARPSTAERGYGAEHQKLRKEWAVKVAAGGVSCARCGLPIPPGSKWDLGHDPRDRSRHWGPEHQRCNRGWKRLGGIQNPGLAKDPFKPGKRLGSKHQKQRQQLLPLAYGRPCPYCGCVMLKGQALDLDHVIPRAFGGKDGPVRIAHAGCNRSAGARLGNLTRRRVG